MYFLNFEVNFFFIFLKTLCPFVINLSFFVEKCQCQNQCFFKFPWKSTKFCKFWPSVPKQCFFKWFQCFFHSKIWSLCFFSSGHTDFQSNFRIYDIRYQHSAKKLIFLLFDRPSESQHVSKNSKIITQMVIQQPHLEAIHHLWGRSSAESKLSQLIQSFLKKQNHDNKIAIKPAHGWSAILKI